MDRIIQNNAARCWRWRNAEKIKGCRTSDRTITPGRRWVCKLEGPGQDIALKCGDAGVSSVGSWSQLVTVSSMRVVALAATFPEWLLWGEEGETADHPVQAKAQSPFLTNPAPPPSFGAYTLKTSLLPSRSHEIELSSPPRAFVLSCLSHVARG